MRVQTIQILLWFDHPRLKGHTISLAKTSSEFEPQCVFFFFFHSTPHTAPTFQRQTPRNSAPVSPQRVYSPSREVSEWVQGPSDHGKGSRQVLWEPKPLVEQISGTWARAQPVSESDGESGGSRMQLSPSHEPDDIRQVTKLQTLFRGLP